MEAPENQFSYEPLNTNDNEIRLVTLLPGHRDDPMLLEIFHASLPPRAPRRSAHLPQEVKDVRDGLPKNWRVYETVDDELLFYNENNFTTSWRHPDPNFSIKTKHSDEAEQDLKLHYEALSYCWGGPSRDKTVCIRPKTSHRLQVQQPKYLKIGQSLMEALKYLRSPGSSRTIWADQLCIDQLNDKERNQQVGLMGKIYTQASRVMAWIGQPSPTSDLALSTLEYLGKQLLLTKDSYRLPYPNCHEPSYYHGLATLPYDGQTWDSIAEILDSPWFSRLWVVQEIRLGSRESVVRCGEKEVAWPLFRRAVYCLYYNHGVPENVFNGCSTQIALCHQDTVQPLQLLIARHSWRGCRDTRDRIYGLLNMLPPALAADLQVDYSKSTREVFQDLTRTRLKQVRRLELFGFCNLVDPAWPSWVPKIGTFEGGAGPGGALFLASGKSQALTSSSISEELEVAAIFIGNVKTINECNCKDMIDMGRFLDQLGLERLQTTTYHNGLTLLEAYLTIFTFGLIIERLPGLEYPSLSELRDAIFSMKTTGYTKRDARLSGIMRWEQLVFRWLRRLSVFRTEEGYIGSSSSSSIAAGDQIFVLLGCSYPLLLRPCSTGSFRVVGECQVAGFMDSEAVLGSLPRPWRVTRDTGDLQPRYSNMEDGRVESEDPRLGPLPKDWEAIDRDPTSDDPQYFAWYRNGETGAEMNSDPRLLPEALRERGVNVQVITLV